MGFWFDPNEFDFDKDVDIDVDTNLDFDTDSDLDSDTDVDVYIDSDPDLDGNVATLTFDVEAVGSGDHADTLATADVFVIAVEDQMSAVGGSMIAAVE